ncbi:cell division topological specificity factor MinE [Kouleothrix aurantiaca]|uniref:Cell division topological specificity factor n=1 Tax=Kouleothrix aurantiaca TaxID=186479 RepID=A0A0P9DET6_9CHLR|nr:cell division topological specificity factor MinE [Kouleothrix aurantiaca]
MSFFNSLFGGKRERSSDVARERLLTVLVHDRVKLTPEMLDKLKAELSAVIAKYVPSVEPGEIEVSLLRGEANDHIKADIPLRRTT